MKCLSCNWYVRDDGTCGCGNARPRTAPYAHEAEIEQPMICAKCERPPQCCECIWTCSMCGEETCVCILPF